MEDKEKSWFLTTNLFVSKHVFNFGQIILEYNIHNLSLTKISQSNFCWTKHLLQNTPENQLVTALTPMCESSYTVSLSIAHTALSRIISNTLHKIGFLILIAPLYPNKVVWVCRVADEMTIQEFPMPPCTQIVSILTQTNTITSFKSIIQTCNFTCVWCMWRVTKRVCFISPLAWSLPKVGVLHHIFDSQIQHMVKNGPKTI